MLNAIKDIKYLLSANVLELTAKLTPTQIMGYHLYDERDRDLDFKF